VSEAVVPHSFSEAAAALAAAATQARPVRVVGGGTKLGWGALPPPDAVQLHMAHLSRVTIHEDGSATINAGTPMVRAQTTFARSGLMLAADPQLGRGRTPLATLGGVVATADTGPLSHRHGPLRDQIVGITVALSDGSIVRTGPRTDHVQDGFDLPRLFTGSFGTLGVILAIDVRLRPLPRQTASTIGSTDRPEQLKAAVETLTQEHRELEALDVAWRDGRGGLLAQVAEERADQAEAAAGRAAAISQTMRACGLEDATVRVDDAGLWARQRAGQRSAEHAVLRVSHRAAQLDDILSVADAARATLVGRAALGISYLTLAVPRVAAVRAALPEGAAAVALDLPATARGAVDPWDVPAGPQLELMREIKRDFDPAGVCNPGVFVGSI
jgi:glycolate oxidase FAD binding subunit